MGGAKPPPARNTPARRRVLAPLGEPSSLSWQQSMQAFVSPQNSGSPQAVSLRHSASPFQVLLRSTSKPFGLVGERRKPAGFRSPALTRPVSSACSQALHSKILLRYSLNPDQAGFSSKLHEPPSSRFMSRTSSFLLGCGISIWPPRFARRHFYF